MIRSRFVNCIAIALVIALTAVATSVAAPNASFTRLGDLPGGEDFDFLSYSKPAGISADGKTVVGVSIGFPIAEPFIWTQLEGMKSLGFLNGPRTTSEATAISGNGAVIIGTGDRLNLGDQRTEPFRWTKSDGMISLGHPPGSADSTASAVSFDGSIIVGSGRSPSGSYQAFRWAAGAGFASLGDLPGGLNSSLATGVSNDGSVIVGYSSSSRGSEAFRWTAEGGMVGLGGLPGASISSYATNVSADGATIVGDAARPNTSRREAFRWTASSGMLGLGQLPGGDIGSLAHAVSANGSIIVGEATTRRSSDDTAYEAFIWDANHGMRSVHSILTAAGVDLTGWGLRSVTAITPDGKIIAGWGHNPRGFEEAWIADISQIVPEPSGCTLVITALLAQHAVRTRRRRSSATS